MDDNVDATARRTPWHLWLVGTLGLLWNSIGVFDFSATQSRVEAYRGQFTPAQLAALDALPLWLVVFWGLAVWGGFVGAVLLLLRRRPAVPVLLVSLLAMIVTAVHDFVSDGGLYTSGGTGQGFVLVIFGVALGLWMYARVLAGRGVLVGRSSPSVP